MTKIGKPGVRFYSSRGELYLRKMESKRDVCTGCLCNFRILGIPEILSFDFPNSPMIGLKVMF